MGLLSDLSRGFVIYTVVMWIVAIVVSFIQGFVAVTLLLIIVFIIPASVLAHDYLKNRRKKAT